MFVLTYAVTAAMHLPFVVAAEHAFSGLGLAQSWWLAGSAGVLLAAAFHQRLRLLMSDRPIGPLRALAEEAYFVHWTALVLVAPLHLLAAVWAASSATASLGECLLASYAAGLAVGLYGVSFRRRRVVIGDVVVAIEGLPAALEGYRIAQLSDVHLGSMCPRGRVERWVKRANAVGADVVVLTGDYVTSGTHFHHDIALSLGGLHAPDGVFAIMGNHDYFGDGEPLVSLLSDRGVVVLSNERRVIERDGARLQLIGVDDVYTGRNDVARALAQLDDDLPSVVLAHDPRQFDELAARGVDLVLSGHTHWGQIAVPLLATRLNYARLVYRYHAGRYRHTKSTLYISPGLGTTGPPVRIGTWPEISVVTLRAATAKTSARPA